jgi:two-component system OmpR family response regulator
MFNQELFQLCILDVMLPHKDGFTLAKEMRVLRENIPIIFLTSRAMELDKIKGFEIGCDDYITKPFSIMELILRVNAILKRTNTEGILKARQMFSISENMFSTLRNASLNFLIKQKKRYPLKRRNCLRIFCEKENELIHRNYLMNKVWVYATIPISNTSTNSFILLIIRSPISLPAKYLVCCLSTLILHRAMGLDH